MLCHQLLLPEATFGLKVEPGAQIALVSTWLWTATVLPPSCLGVGMSDYNTHARGGCLCTLWC